MTPLRNEWIDLLRAFACMAVVLFHFNVMPQSHSGGAAGQAWCSFWQYGHLGVGVFFTLSGYCLLPGWYRSAGLRDFLLRRAWRILPPYWASLLLVATLAVIFRVTTGVNDIAALPHTTGSVLATLLLLTKPVTSVPTINWVYWTLSDLLAFYLLFGLPLIMPGASRIPALAGLHVVLCVVDLAFRPVAAGAFFFIRYWPVFGIGVALALWSRHRRGAIIMLAVSAVHASWTIMHGNDTTHYVLMGCLTVVAVTGTLATRLPAWLRPLSGMGRISYSVYLVHVPVGIHVLFRLLPASFPSASALIGCQLAVLAGTLLFAALFYLAVERPLLPAAVPASRP